MMLSRRYAHVLHNAALHLFPLLKLSLVAMFEIAGEEARELPSPASFRV
jgi:hypothetical protein